MGIMPAKGGIMLFGASTFIWTSPFSNATLGLIDHARRIGFDIIEICVEDPATIDVEAIRPRLAAAGMRATVCGVLGPNRDLSSENLETQQTALAYLTRCIDIAAALGSSVVLGPIYACVGNAQLLDKPARLRQWQRAVNNLRKVADLALPQGVGLGLEPLNRFETDLVNTVEQGLAMIEDIGRENVGLLLDTFHMNIEERDIPAALRRAGGHIFELHACANDRGTPGQDHLPWSEIAGALRDGGYDGPVVIEAFTPSIREIARAVSIWRPLAESEDDLATDGLRHLRQVFGG
jgi:D-psicose/D-tagatose/L-ribulose 3-epimerase